MNSFEYLKYKGKYPENWNELKLKQLLFVASVLRGRLSREVAETLILQKFTEIPWKHFYNIKAEALADMSKTIAFIFDKKELTNNLLSEIKVKRKTFYGPENACLDLSFEQFFGYSETYFQRFAESGSYQELDNLIASLYVKKKSKFSGELFENNLKYLTKIDNNKKFAILLFYLGCRDLMASKFEDLFKSNKTKSIKSDFHYFELVDNLSNENIVNNEKIKKSNIYEAFVRLTAMIKKADTIKKQPK